MKNFTNKLLMLLVVATCISFSSCTMRLVDFTVISTKNVNLNINKKDGKRTTGKKSYFLGLGFNLKDAIDLALENAGKEYDMLVDGVVRYSNFPFVVIVKVEGVAVSTDSMKKSMGDAGYEEWLKKQNNVLSGSAETADSDK